jgi:hypothetical protein
MYNRAVVDASIAEVPVRQPTGQEMLRYWQAFMSVKDAQYPHPVARTLSVYKGVVQIRLSFLVITIGAFLIAILAAALVRWANLRNGVSKIHLPSSQLDWIVQAAREHVRYHASPKAIVTPRDRLSTTSFASHNQDLAFVVTPDLETRIATGSESLMPQYSKS